MKTSSVRVATLVLVSSTLFWGLEARADIRNWDISGQIYTKWLYRNNDQMGIVNYGNPFWPENFSGDNGVGSEFEWNIRGTPSRFVTAYVRVKSRFGSTWHDFWENGDFWYPQENTSGQSLGMDHAEYMKLRGYAMDIHPPYAWLDNIHIGSTDVGFFNTWTFGRVRYIDRDNTKGVFFQGSLLDGDLRWTLGIIALPRLWAGPGWSTGVGDVVLNNPFHTMDYGYALHMDHYLDALGLDTIVDLLFTNDFEIDVADPDADGSLYPNCLDELDNAIPGCEPDGAVDLEGRYRQFLGSLQLRFEPVRDLGVDLLGAIAMQRINELTMSNGVALNAGVSPVPYKDTLDWAARARFDIVEPFGARNLHFQLEYFNIGEDWVNTFSARREDDVLLTDGFITGGGQLPTLNIANEFMDFNDGFYESCIGWHGGTLLIDYILGNFQFLLEQTAITYNTNMQDRDTDAVYPNFLHHQGYTDTWFFDYANTLDRGRDPRAVYQENQDRFSLISGLRTTWDTGWLTGLEIEAFAKFIRDTDGRDLSTDRDDYTGNLLFTQLKFSLPINNEIDINFGGNFDRWDEENRSGNPAEGYSDYMTLRGRAFAGFTFNFGGATFGYHGEWVLKDQEREIQGDRTLDIFRSKAYLTVAW
ncbi:MAG: hypothetical protein JW797_02970 [Bradymonadales bacterium]|nr:hypothetical protein [Bradymonadales bacterium]